jgi:hypothetical protein
VRSRTDRAAPRGGEAGAGCCDLVSAHRGPTSPTPRDTQSCQLRAAVRLAVPRTQGRPPRTLFDGVPDEHAATGALRGSTAARTAPLPRSCGPCDRLGQGPGREKRSQGRTDPRGSGTGSRTSCTPPYPPQAHDRVRHRVAIETRTARLKPAASTAQEISLPNGRCVCPDGQKALSCRAATYRLPHAKRDQARHRRKR